MVQHGHVDGPPRPVMPRVPLRVCPAAADQNKPKAFRHDAPPPPPRSYACVTPVYCALAVEVLLRMDGYGQRETPAPPGRASRQTPTPDGGMPERCGILLCVLPGGLLRVRVCGAGMYSKGGGGGGTPPPPLPMFEADSQNFASTPSAPRAFKLENFRPAFGGDHRGTQGGGKVPAKSPYPPPPFRPPSPPSLLWGQAGFNKILFCLA